MSLSLHIQQIFPVSKSLCLDIHENSISLSLKIQQISSLTTKLT